MCSISSSSTGKPSWRASLRSTACLSTIPGRRGLFQDRDGGAFYRSTWDAALASDPDWIFITTWNVPFAFGGTSLLITVVVVMDFMAQLQAHLMSHQYEGLLKKANLKSLGAPGMVR